MSNKNDDFWKELMGEDFKVQDLDSVVDSRPPDGTQPDKGFTIEFVNRDGKAVPAPEEPPAPEKPNSTPTQPQPPYSNPPQQRPASTQPQPPYSNPPQQRPASTQAQPPYSNPPQQRPAPSQPQPPYSNPPQQRPTPPVQSAPELQQTRKIPDIGRMPSETRGSADTGRPDARPSGEAPWYVSETELSETGPRSAPSGGSRGGKKKPEDDFEVEFDFDSEYADVDEKPVRRGRTRRTGCLSGILMSLFVVCVSAILASLGWVWATDVLGLDGEYELVEVTLPKEIFHTEKREKEDEDGNKTMVEVNVADIDKVAEELYNKGLIRYKWLFKLFSKFSDAEVKVQAGTFTLNMNYDYRALISGMNSYTGKREEVWVTVPEGYSLSQIVSLIESKGVCDRESMLDALANYDFDFDFLDKSTLGDPKRLEGYLFPDSYIFYKDDNAPNVIYKFLENFEVKWTEEFDEQAAALGYTRDQILAVASMIEKEAGADTERDQIASVIYNRLEHPERGTNGYLQIDATIYYIIADTGEDFSTSIDSPYNTYMYPGLPAGPIANPGIASIRAALEPAKTNYFYYALGKDGLHRFFETYEGFINFVNSEQYGG